METLDELTRREILKCTFNAISGLALSNLVAGRPTQANPLFTKPRINVPSIDKVILHTTEAGDRSSEDSVVLHGSCNYLIATDGTTKEIVKEGKKAHHAGLSMWGDLTDLNSSSIGIEIVGHHNQESTPTDAQKRALKTLIAELKLRYELKDEDFLPHSQVAFGNPNRYWGKKHRGRKRCGWQFADNHIRAELGLHSKPKYDPNVENGELIIADQELNDRLYAKIEAQTVEPPEMESVKTHPVTKVIADPSGDLKVIGRDGKTAWSVAKARYDDEDTIYIIGDKVIRGSELTPEHINTMPLNTPLLMGYHAREITPEEGPWRIAGKLYDSPDSFYKEPGQPGLAGLTRGDQIEDFTTLKKGTHIIYKKRA